MRWERGRDGWEFKEINNHRERYISLYEIGQKIAAVYCSCPAI